MRELSASLCRGSQRTVAEYAALNVCMTGSTLIPGMPVLNVVAGAVDAMQIATKDILYMFAHCSPKDRPHSVAPRGF